MKLSLKMIAEKLEKELKILDFKDIYSTLRLSRPVFLTDETELAADTLYISSADRLPKDLAYQNGCALIISGTPDTDILNAPAVILISDENDVFKIHNKVADIFNFFDEWHRRLEYISTHCSRLTGFEKFLDASEEVFENLLAVSDSSFNYITASKAVTAARASAPADGRNSPACSVSKLPSDIMAILKQNPAHHMLNVERDVFVASDPEFPHRIMVRNIFHDNSVIYRVTVSETERPFCETDYLFLDFLASYIEKAVKRDYAVPAYDTGALAGIFNTAIVSGTWTGKLFEAELTKIGWKTTDRYSVLYITASNQNLLLDFIPIYCMDILRDFSGVFAFSHRGNIIIIINHARFSDAENSPSEDIDMTELEAFLRENGLTAGLSNPFDDLYRLKTHFRQAEIAYEIGSSHCPEVLIHHFSDQVVNYMVNMSAAEFTSDELLSPVYTKLKQYDLENNSEYLKTLREYLIQNMNAVQTASALFIHRATLIYRIKRICEIGGTELKKPDELIHLALSFILDGR